jgi:hypothetical protein
MKVAACLVVLAMTIGCRRARDESRTSRAQDPVPAPTVAARAPAGEGELHALIVELAGAKVCDMLRDRWTGIRDAERATVTGTLWIRGCNESVDRDQIDVQVSGTGWQWLDLANKTYVRRGTERFDFTSELRGTVTVSYDPRTKAAALAFRASDLPHVMLVPRAAVSGTPMARDQLRNVVLGAIVGAVAGRRTPAATDPMVWDQLGSFDITANFPLCAGGWDVSVGSRTQAPELAGQPAPIDLGPGGLALYGPLRATDAVTIVADAEGGAPRASLMCADDASRLANAYLASTPLPARPTLASTVVNGQATLRVEWPHCPVVLVVASTSDRPVRLGWRRSPDELPALTTPALRCVSPGGPEQHERPAR